MNGTKAACFAAIAIMGAVGVGVIMADESRPTTPAPTSAAGHHVVHEVAVVPGSVASIPVPRAAIAAVYPDLTIPPCATEDAANCYWDADSMGDGSGRSFITLSGVYYYAPESTEGK
jgi:hypothetical protein